MEKKPECVKKRTNVVGAAIEQTDHENERMESDRESVRIGSAQVYYYQLLDRDIEARKGARFSRV